MNKRKAYTFILAFVVIILIVFVISYGYLYYSSTQEEVNTITTACYNLSYSEDNDGVSMTYNYPITDEEAQNLDAYTMTLTNNCNKSISFQVNLNILESSTTSNTAIRIDYNGNIGSLTDYDEVSTTLANATTAYRLGSIVLSHGQSTTISLKAWLSSDVNENEEENTVFANKITIDINNATNDDTKLLTNVIKNNYNIDSNINYSTIDRGMYEIADNDGTSYVLRGNDENNYVTFAGYKWRIVRINGDGTIRLILNNSIVNTNYNTANSVGYTYDNLSRCTLSNSCTEIEGTSSTIKTYLQDWYNNTLSSYDSFISYAKYCNDTSISSTDETYTYNTSVRINSNTPSLKCNNTEQNYGGYYTLKVGLLSVDEQYISSSSYAIGMSMSPANTTGENSIYISYNQALETILASDSYDVYPVINLNADVSVISGQGTASNPYIIDTN